MSLGTVVLATRCGFHVGFLRGGMQAFVLEREHGFAGLHCEYIDKCFSFDIVVSVGWKRTYSMYVLRLCCSAELEEDDVDDCHCESLVWVLCLFFLSFFY